MTSIAPPADAPTIRASFVFDNVKSIEALGPEAFEQIRAQIPAAILETMEDATRVAWIPVEVDVAWTEAADRVVGRQRMRACMRDGLLRAVEGPLLSPVRRSVQAVFGITPAAYLRRAPLVYSLIYKNVGGLEVTHEDRSAVLRFYDLPDVIWASEPYVDGLAGAIDAVMVLSATDRGPGRGTVERMPGAGTETREVCFVCRW